MELNFYVQSFKNNMLIGDIKMELNRAIELFKKNNKIMNAYNHALGVMSYDAETVAPKNASEGMGCTMGIMSEMIYKLTVNDENFEVIDTLMTHIDELDFITRREAEEAYKQLEQLKKISMEEYTNFQVLLTEARDKWVEAKINNQYSIFEPYLSKIVAYNRKIAALIKPDIPAYDYWLNEFEPGASMEMLDKYFEKIKAALVPLIHKISEKSNFINTSCIEKKFSIEKQRMFSDYLMEVMNINRDDCGIGETEHPFTINFNKHDVRITTHYHEENITSSMYSVIHEGGHALYELNTGDDLIGSPLAGGASMGIHESQSRFFENIIGRSEAFIKLIFPRMKEIFSEQFENCNWNDLYLAVNKIEPSLIRTEADELTYSMHIMVRYELEKRLMNGTLSTLDLPYEWNKLYKEYLGVDVPSDSLGVLQDSHWSGGTFGYFPSYSLGSAYGAQIFAHMRKEMDIDKLISEQCIGTIVEWLTEKIYKYGSLLKPTELIKNSCGEDFDSQYYIDYLIEKFKRIYKL